MNPSPKPYNVSSFTNPVVSEVQSLEGYPQFKHGKAEVTKGKVAKGLKPSSTRARVLSHVGWDRDHQHHHRLLPRPPPPTAGKDRTQSCRATRGVPTSSMLGYGM